MVEVGILKVPERQENAGIPPATGVGGGDAGDETAPPKFLIRWISGQNALKSGKNFWEPSKTPWKSEQKWRPACFDWKWWRPNWHEELFFFLWRSLFWSIFRAFLEVIFIGVFSGKFGEIWAKILLIPQNLPAPTPMQMRINCHRQLRN